MESTNIGYSIPCLLVAALTFITSPAFGQAKPIELKYSTFYPATHKMGVVSAEWGKEIEKRTNGRVKVTIFYSGTLTPPTKSYEGVINGISDIGWGVFGYSRGRFPLSEVSDVPLGATSSMAATKAFNEYYRKFRPKELAGVKVLYLFATGPSFMHMAKKPIVKLEDLKGIKIRFGGLQAKVAEALGAVPVALPVGEAYDALSKGVAEGTIVPMESLEGFKLAEVVKYTSLNFGTAPTGGQWIVMNTAKFNGLPKDIQNIMEKVSQEWIVKSAIAWDEIDRSGKEYALKLGHKFDSLTPDEEQRWVKAVKPIIDDYIKDTKAKGLPGDQVVKFWQDYLKKNP